MRHDYHAHSTYSDGEFLLSMADAAADAGLEGVGYADHCNVAEREGAQRAKKAMGFNLDITYERRREAIEWLRDRGDVRIFDAVEMDYDTRDEAAIERFLAEADFDYVVGSVHVLDGTNVHAVSHFEDKAESERRDLIESYYDDVVALVESGLFDVVAHVDLVERNVALRGLADEADYDRVARALAGADTVPEVNAGRALDEYGEFHPSPEFLTALEEYDVGVTLGTDAHTPDELRARVPELEAFVAERDLEPVELVP